MRITVNADSWHEAAQKALTASGRANDSSFIGGQHPPAVTRRASSLAAHAVGMSNHSNPSAVFRGMIAHETASRAHQAASNYHKTWADNAMDPYTRRTHTQAYSLHTVAAQSHIQAARAAAGKLGMDYRMHRGFRQSIREARPHDTAPRLIYADFLEEHGLPKEARRLRLDPTGHIGRAATAYARVMRLGREPDENYEMSQNDHYHALRASRRANRLKTREAHLRAARLNSYAANTMAAEGDAERGFAIEDPAFGQRYHSRLIRRWEEAHDRHNELADYHMQQANQAER